MMAVNEREKIHYELLEALYRARKQVEYLEAALAHNAAYLGTGVEREDFPALPEDDADPEALPEEVMRYLGLAGRESDVSDYLGREGDDKSRPRLGSDAPDIIRPKTEPRIGQLVGQLAFGHPNDILTLPGPQARAAPPLPEEESQGEVD
ncbi:hypothetical protein LJB81_01745 [Desulfovibrio sp. OttesenSCG-928-M14]|nr:hypothetical protein [Desulfovibrio sp. OttesenSCG-928-M14]